MNLEQIAAKRKGGQEKFKYGSEEIDLKLIQFWQWAVSDLLSNTTRGILSEFIVASALGVDNGLKNEWESYDITDLDGTKIEVKTSAYLQSWAQNNLSKIYYDIRPSRRWDAKTGKYDDVAIRQSDIYIFCLLKHKDKNTVNPLDLEQWIFYILPTKVLNEKLKSQKRISLSNLLKLEPIKCSYNEINTVIDNIKNQHLPCRK